MDTGVCRNPACARAISGAPIDRYPGPGEYCPDCGERLDALAARPGDVAVSAEAAPAPEAPSQAVSPDEPDAPRRSRVAAPSSPSAESGNSRPAIFAIVGFVIAIGLGLLFVRPLISLGSKPANLRVCGTSLTTRLASDIIASYVAKNGAPPSSSATRQAGSCDVQFGAGAQTGGATEIARDGVVIVVHPHNPIRRLTSDQLRGIVGGTITDWSQLGGERGTIFMMLPSETTDERRALDDAMLRSTRIASRTLVVPTSSDIVRVVAGANGRRWIGVVAFSSAVPAKVVQLGSAAVPSVLSIASHRYPLTLAVTVRAKDAQDTGASALIAYAHSADGQAVVTRDGFVAKDNF